MRSILALASFSDGATIHGNPSNVSTGNKQNTAKPWFKNQTEQVMMQFVKMDYNSDTQI